MVLLLKILYNGYNEYFVSKEGSTTAGYPLMESPVLITCIVAGYLYFVKDVGPKWMENRKPFDLRNAIILFNIIQILANFYLAMAIFFASYYKPDYSFSCQPLPEPGSENDKTETYFTYMYFILKVIDLLDTVFFVLRKKSNQISFLHVYHHAGMVITTWCGTKFCPGGHAILLGIINCWVHVFMYTYYLMTAFNPEVKNSLKWKKRVTQIQLIQFGILMVHFSRAFLTNCSYPQVLSGIGFTQNIFMFMLFGDFYRRAYMKKPTTKKIQ